MIRPIYVIRDQKVSTFGFPMVYENDKVAIRAFTDSFNQVPIMANNPQDFDLFRAGEFDETTGLMSSGETVQFIINGLNCLELTRQENDHEAQESSTQVGDDSPVQSST